MNMWRSHQIRKMATTAPMRWPIHSPAVLGLPNLNIQEWYQQLAGGRLLARLCCCAEGRSDRADLFADTPVGYAYLFADTPGGVSGAAIFGTAFWSCCRRAGEGVGWRLDNMKNMLRIMELREWYVHPERAWELALNPVFC